MKIKNVFKILKAIFAGAIGKKRTPAFVSWEVTSRCLSDCIYCGRPQEILENELDTGEALSMIEQLASLGCIRLSLTGGEPMLREDLPEIVSSCKEKKIEVNINSSGRGVAEKLKDLPGIESLTLSLDGPEEVNDYIRGKGAFREVMNAISAAKNSGIPVSILCVLSSENLKTLPEFLKFIKKEKLPTAFQPADPLLLRGTGENPIAPDPEELNKALDLLLREKSNNIFIESPGRLLRHFKQFPKSTPVACGGGFIFCRVDSVGRVWRCGRVRPPGEGLDFRKIGFEKAFSAMPPMRCSSCFGAGQAWANLVWSRFVSSGWGK
ncbi:MAG: radical SAM protein [Candidatus Eremiobacteraeota bacterium]|nr:radical SAM protein [Candidatus Eremiobacteraeota bacterium]